MRERLVQESRKKRKVASSRRTPKQVLRRFAAREEITELIDGCGRDADEFRIGADVFGAIPSLHIVYPFLAMVYGWRLRRFRPFGVGYFLLVCFSAVYLNHHYLLDIFVGLGIAGVVMAGARVLFGAAVLLLLGRRREAA